MTTESKIRNYHKRRRKGKRFSIELWQIQKQIPPRSKRKEKFSNIFNQSDKLHESLWNCKFRVVFLSHYVRGSENRGTQSENEEMITYITTSEKINELVNKKQAISWSSKKAMDTKDLKWSYDLIEKLQFYTKQNWSFTQNKTKQKMSVIFRVRHRKILNVLPSSLSCKQIIGRPLRTS